MTAAADLKSVIGDLQRRFSRPLTKRELNKTGDLAAEAIRRRTREGFGVKVTGGNRKKLKKLSTQYIEFRKRFKSLSSETTATTSNLTLTGQMIDSVKTKRNKTRVGTRGKALVLVATTGSKNTKKALFQADAGRIFMNLGRKELREINEFMTKAIKSKRRRR